MKIKNFTARLAAFLMMFTGTQAATQAQDTFQEVDYNKDRTVFTLNAPSTATVKVHIYNDSQSKATKTVKMKKIAEDRWQATVKGDLKGKYYTFSVDGRQSPGVFAKAVSINGKRGAIIDMSETDPEGWADDSVEPLAPQDWMIYEMHHRDFSIDESSLVPDEWKGRFMALTADVSLQRLKQLGINAVQILPSFDYASVDESKPGTPQYNWGYDPLNYNVPEGSYSTDPTDPKTRIREFKMMVQALHRAGIRVILDVVYNHTFDLKGSNFELTYPQYYYRYTSDGKVSDGSGCGNETASEKPLMRQFMIESVRHWVNEYHIDGFRFDLMGIHDLETMRRIRAALPERILIYGEGWSAGACAIPNEQLAMKANVGQLPGIAAFGDDMRDALRGPFSDDKKGAFIAGIEGEEESLKAGIAGMVAHPQVDYSKVNYSKVPWAVEPTQAIGYVSCHDDMCLVDRLRSSMPGIGDDELARLDLLAQTAVFTAQSIPFMLSGEEVLRDKKLVHNSYNSPDSINRIDWTRAESFATVHNYYCRLTRLRAHHPAFRLGSADEVRKRLSFLPTQPCLVAFMIATDGLEGEEWGDIVVILNASRDRREVQVPEGTWTAVCALDAISEDGLFPVLGPTVTVAPQTALILHK